jgi:hypothetical protein
MRAPPRSRWNGGSACDRGVPRGQCLPAARAVIGEAPALAAHWQGPPPPGSCHYASPGSGSRRHGPIRPHLPRRQHAHASSCPPSTTTTCPSLDRGHADDEQALAGDVARAFVARSGAATVDAAWHRARGRWISRSIGVAASKCVIVTARPAAAPIEASGSEQPPMRRVAAMAPESPHVGTQKEG